MPFYFPHDIESVFREFRTCEFSTFAKDGAPITWPTAFQYQPEQDRFLITTSIGLPQKAINIRRNPKVSLLFSDPTGSGLHAPPAVLVQGDATAPDQIVTSTKGLETYWRDIIFARQPSSALYSRNALTQWLTDWYYMRLMIYITPRQVWSWANGDFSQAPQKIEARHVG